jgi:drug/metabolite transporter (DMT)-like permease
MTGMAVCAPLLPLVPIPTPAAMQMLVGTTIVHWLYQLAMMRTLSMGSLSLAFPIMRGLAPILIAVVSMAAFGEQLSALAWTGLVLATGALVAFGLAGHRLRAEGTDPRIFIYAIMTACLVAAYSTIDAAGVRAMKPGDGWAYIIWFFVVGGLPIAVTALASRRERLLEAVRSEWKPGLAAGALSLVSYGMAMYAMGIVPVAHVAALRETSSVFAALFGWLLLGESFGFGRIALAILAVTGLAILKLS